MKNITLVRDQNGVLQGIDLSKPAAMSPEESFRRSVLKISPDALGITPMAAKALGGSFSLTEKDLEDFQEAEMRLWILFRDCREHSQDEMEKVTGQRQADRRMRNLRSRLRAKGWTITPRRDEPSRLYYYRLRPMQLEIGKGLTEEESAG